MNNATRDSIVEIVGRIQDFVLDADAADDALGRIAELLDSDKALMVRLAPDRRRDMTLGRFGFERTLIDGILGQRDNPDTFLAHPAQWEPGMVASDSDCVRSAENKQKAVIYRELLKPNRIEHTLLGVVDTGELHHVLLWFHRGAGRGPYRKADKRLLETLMPHWQRVIRQKQEVDFQHSALMASGIILDQSPFGLYVLDLDGTVLFTNETANQQSKANDGIAMRRKTIVISDREVRSAYEGMLAALRQGRKQDDPRLAPMAFQKKTGGGSYQLGMRRLRMPGRRGSLAARNAVAVFVYDTGERMELSIGGLRSLYHLTESEARVCDLLYQSKNLPEVAKLLGISINTAKTHLTRSFRKVGVQSQAELVRRLNSQLYIS